MTTPASRRSTTRPPAGQRTAGDDAAAQLRTTAAFNDVAQQAVLAPLDPVTPHAAPGPIAAGELQLPYPREMVTRAAETFGALSDPSRAQIVAALLVRELSVGDIAASVGLTQSATSHHLRLLRDRRLVRFHRHGNQVYYSIDDVHVAAMFAEAFRHIRHVHQQLPDHPYRLGAD